MNVLHVDAPSISPLDLLVFSDLILIPPATPATATSVITPHCPSSLLPHWPSSSPFSVPQALNLLAQPPSPCDLYHVLTPSLLRSQAPHHNLSLSLTGPQSLPTTFHLPWINPGLREVQLPARSPPAPSELVKAGGPHSCADRWPVRLMMLTCPVGLWIPHFPSPK